MLADTAAEAVDARTVRFLLRAEQKKMKEEEEEERRRMEQVKEEEEEAQKSAQWFADLDSFLATPWAREAAARGSQERKRNKKKKRKRKVPKTSSVLSSRCTVPRKSRRHPRRGAEAQVVLAAFVVDNGGKFLAGFACGEAERTVFFPCSRFSASYFVWTKRTVMLCRVRRWQRQLPVRGWFCW